MDSLKSDTLRKVFGARKQRTYAQHFGRVGEIPIFDYEERIKERLVADSVFERLWTMTDSDRAEEICNAMPEALASDYQRLVLDLGKTDVSEKEMDEILMGPIKDLAWTFALEQLRKDRESGRKIVIEDRREEIARKMWLTSILARELEDLPSFYAEYVINQIYWSFSWRYPNWDMDEAAVRERAGPLIDAAKEAERDHKTRTGGGIRPC